MTIVQTLRTIFIPSLVRANIMLVLVIYGNQASRSIGDLNSNWEEENLLSLPQTSFVQG